MDHEVYDTRNPARTDGPYEDAEIAAAVAKKLNEFIYRNSTLGKLLPKGEVTGPYLVRPVTAKPAQKLTAVFDASLDPHLTAPKEIR
jgi:hypothetical protein